MTCKIVYLKGLELKYSPRWTYVVAVSDGSPVKFTYSRISDGGGWLRHGEALT